MIRIAASILPLALLFGVRLEAKLPALNDRAEIQLESAIDLEIKTKDSASNEAVRATSLLRTERFTTVVTAAPDGSRTYKVSCSSSSVQRSGTNAPVTTEKTELEGKNYWVTRAGATTTVKNEDGSEASAATWALCAWEDYGKLLPKIDVDAGSTFTIEGEDVSALLAMGKLTDIQAQITGKVESLDNDAAVLSYTGTISGKTAENFDLKVTLEDCKMTFVRAKGRPTSISMKGTLEANKKVMQGYIPPGSHRPREEQIGEATVKSKKFEVTVTYR